MICAQCSQPFTLAPEDKEIIKKLEVCDPSFVRRVLCNADWPGGMNGIYIGAFVNCARKKF